MPGGSASMTIGSIADQLTNGKFQQHPAFNAARQGAGRVARQNPHNGQRIAVHRRVEIHAAKVKLAQIGRHGRIIGIGRLTSFSLGGGGGSSGCSLTDAWARGFCVHIFIALNPHKIDAKAGISSSIS